MLEIRPYRESDQGAVVALWRESGLVRPWNDPAKDIHRKLRVQRDLFLMGTFGRPAGSDSAVDDVVCMGKRLIPD